MSSIDNSILINHFEHLLHISKDVDKEILDLIKKCKYEFGEIFEKIIEDINKSNDLMRFIPHLKEKTLIVLLKEYGDKELIVKEVCSRFDLIILLELVDFIKDFSLAREIISEKYMSEINKGRKYKFERKYLGFLNDNALSTTK